MKLKSNYYLFSNFNNPQIENCINKDKLVTNTIYNLTTANKVIEPTSNFANFFEHYFDSNSYSILKANNSDLLKQIILCTYYDYYNEESNSICERCFVIDINFNLYELDYINLIFNPLNFKFNSMPKIFKDNNKLYFVSYNDLCLLVSDEYYPIILTSLPNIVSFANLDSYTFISTLEDKFSIYLSTQTELFNIENNLEFYGKIQLLPENGEVIKLLIYKNKLYVIQKFAISRIDISSNNFSIQSQCSVQSEIKSNTIELIDDYIIFFTSSGLYLFDGNDLKQIFKELTRNIVYNNLESITFNNKYYLKTDYYLESILNTVILEFDIENNYCTIYKVGNVINMNLIKSLNHYCLNIITSDDNNQYDILVLDLTKVTKFEKYIKFNKLTFDESPLKVLNEIKIQSVGKFRIYINSDIQSAYYDVNGSAYIKNIGIKGQFFEFVIKSLSSFMIESLLLKTTSYTED